MPWSVTMRPLVKRFTSPGTLRKVALPVGRMASSAHDSTKWSKPWSKPKLRPRLTFATTAPVA